MSSTELNWIELKYTNMKLNFNIVLLHLKYNVFLYVYKTQLYLSMFFVY